MSQQRAGADLYEYTPVDERTETAGPFLQALTELRMGQENAIPALNDAEDGRFEGRRQPAVRSLDQHVGPAPAVGRHAQLLVAGVERPHEVYLRSGDELKLPLHRYRRPQLRAVRGDSLDVHVREIPPQVRRRHDHSRPVSGCGFEERQARLLIDRAVINPRQHVGMKVDHERLRLWHRGAVSTSRGYSRA